jgi:hypothetical protein
MPIPRIVRQWNKAGLNRVTKHVAPLGTRHGVIIHRGRRSGRLYQTPVNVFSVKGRLCLRPDLRPGHRLGQERLGRGRLRATHARARYPARSRLAGA